MTKLLTAIGMTEEIARLEYLTITEHIVKTAEKHRFTFDEADDFDLLIGTNLKDAICRAVSDILYKTYKKPISDELLFIHMEYHFVEKQVLHLLNTKDPKSVNIDIAKLIIEKSKEYLLTGDLSICKNEDSYFSPSFGTMQEWTAFIIGVYEMHEKGDFTRYNSSLEILLK